MKNFYFLVFLLLTCSLNAQFNSNGVHIFQNDITENLVLGATSVGVNSAEHKVYIDLRPHFTLIGDDERGIKFKTGNFAIEIDNSATSINSTYDQPVIKPSGNNVGFLGKPFHRWWYIYADNIDAIDIKCSTFCATSDASLKDNFRPIEKPLEKILALETWKYDLHIPNSLEVKKDKIGFIAQDLEELFPELAQKNDDNGLYTVDYLGMIPVLVEGMKEQQKIINQQQEAIIALRLMVEKLIKE